MSPFRDAVAWRVKGAVAWLALGGVICGLFVARPHVVERWALYLGSPSAPRSATLYLDPFPNDWSCETRARLFRANAEPAFCAGRRELAFGAATDAVLAADFNGPWALGAYCRPRRAPVAQVRSRFQDLERPASTP